mmetsp:Transcript_10230/g.22536  ORF Transcript_10230/g.22536 Transcript_10230/m.22536 type:complete len:318 (+) Transcript_10230:1730-2683(+)
MSAMSDHFLPNTMPLPCVPVLGLPMYVPLSRPIAASSSAASPGKIHVAGTNENSSGDLLCHACMHRAKGAFLHICKKASNRVTVCTGANPSVESPCSSHITLASRVSVASSRQPIWAIAICTAVREPRQWAVHTVTGSRIRLFIFLAHGSCNKGFTPKVKGKGSSSRCSWIAATGIDSIDCSLIESIVAPGDRPDSATLGLHVLTTAPRPVGVAAASSSPSSRSSSCTSILASELSAAPSFESPSLSSSCASSRAVRDGNKTWSPHTSGSHWRLRSVPASTMQVVEICVTSLLGAQSIAPTSAATTNARKRFELCTS